jgi:hypothetical protein
LQNFTTLSGGATLVNQHGLKPGKTRSTRGVLKKTGVPPSSKGETVETPEHHEEESSPLSQYKA